MLRKILFTVFLFSLVTGFSQVEEVTIPFFRNASNVIETDVKINGFDYRFIFDTGASAVSFGMDLFNQMRDRGIFTDDDIIAKTKTTLANGSLANAFLIKIKKFTIGDSFLQNIDAMVIEGTNVPPLLGQSVLENYGTITIDNTASIIILRTTATVVTHIKELKLIPCLANSVNETEVIRAYLENATSLNILTLSQETKIPPIKALMRINDKITLRYFDEKDIDKVTSLFDFLMSKGYRKNQIALEDMTPYFRTTIPGYIEVWIK